VTGRWYPRRQPRVNPDARIRELERRAAAGDPGARTELIRARIRAGEVERISVEDLLWAGPGAMAALPASTREKLLCTLMTAMVALSPENWFPDHRDNYTCPRGHEPGDQMPGSTVHHQVWFQAYVPSEGIRSYTVFRSVEPLELDYQYDDALQIKCPVLVNCSACNATWPHHGGYELT
jgi:hypothetical protein